MELVGLEAIDSPRQDVCRNDLLIQRAEAIELEVRVPHPLNALLLVPQIILRADLKLVLRI